MDFKDIIKQRRNDIGLTLEEVGNIVGVSKTTVQRWESGEIENVRRDKIELLAQALQVTPAYIMGWKETDNTIDSSQEDDSDEIVILNRAAKNMTADQKKQLLDMARLMFKEEFDN